MSSHRHEHIEPSELSAVLRQDLEFKVKYADLPTFQPWLPIMIVRKEVRPNCLFGPTDVYHITLGEHTWDFSTSQNTVNAWVTELGLRLEWIIRVETETGNIIAIPSINGSNIVRDGFGLSHRALGILGPLERLFLCNNAALLNELGFSGHIYVRKHETKRIRSELLGEPAEALLERILERLEPHR